MVLDPILVTPFVLAVLLAERHAPIVSIGNISIGNRDTREPSNPPKSKRKSN